MYSDTEHLQLILICKLHNIQVKYEGTHITDAKYACCDSQHTMKYVLHTLKHLMFFTTENTETNKKSKILPNIVNEQLLWSWIKGCILQELELSGSN